MVANTFTVGNNGNAARRDIQDCAALSGGSEQEDACDLPDFARVGPNDSKPEFKIQKIFKNFNSMKNGKFELYQSGAVMLIIGVIGILVLIWTVIPTVKTMFKAGIYGLIISD